MQLPNQKLDVSSDFPPLDLVELLVSNSYGHMEIRCAPAEFVQLTPPAGKTCSQYLDPFISFAGGYLVDGSSTSTCTFCPMNSSDQYLATVNIFFDHRWRDLGLLCAYVIFNVSHGFYVKPEF